MAHRPPRVLIVGPIYGGSLETARSAARASHGIGADTRFLDFAAFADGFHALSRVPIAPARHTRLHAEYAKVLGEVVAEFAAEWRPDLMLAIAQAPLNASVLERLRALGTRTAFWFVENHRVLTYWKDVARDYDTFFAIQPEPFLSDVRACGAPQAEYLPTACDRTRHAPVVLTAGERVRFGADVSFAGAPYLNRQRVLLGLLDLAPRLWGDGWHTTELASRAAEAGKRFTQTEMVRIFAATKVNLNIHSANHVEGLDPSPDYLNPRTFELAACEAFQLVDERTPLAQLFAADEMVTFRSVAELRDLIGYYLERPDERAAIAKRARARAITDHTFEHRLRAILRTTLGVDLPTSARPTGPAASLDDRIQHLERASPRMTGDEAMMRVLRHVRDVRL